MRLREMRGAADRAKDRDVVILSDTYRNVLRYTEQNERLRKGFIRAGHYLK